MSVAVAEDLGAEPTIALAPQIYNLPRELARQIWRMSCAFDEEREDGASESGLMEVAWELFLGLSPDRADAYIARTFARSGAPAPEYKRKSYSLPLQLVQRVGRRVNGLKEEANNAAVGPTRREERPTLSLVAEAALIHLVEMKHADVDAALTQFAVRKKRR